MSDASDAIEVYSTYLHDVCPDIDPSILSRSLSSLEATQWDNPESVDAFNQIAVIALIEAEYCDDVTVRQLYVEMALDALNNSLVIEKNCFALAHLSFLMSMTGDRAQAVNVAWDGWLTLTTQGLDREYQCDVIYIPAGKSALDTYRAEVILDILSEASQEQRLRLLLGEAFCLSSLVFYSQMGMRWLQLARGVKSDSAGVNLKLGAAMCTAKQWEGIYYLSHAQKVYPDDVRLMQALYLACRDVDKEVEAQRWLNLAQNSDFNLNCSSTQWTGLVADSPFTYVSLDGNVTLAVESSFRSLVTSVLVAEGDWFEDEMEFWRDWIQPGMTVIDVGANVGVYTFSAARQVGSTGRVVAVEPFSGCVRCLRETCRINGLDWVTVCAGAASNHQGNACLSLNSASELNELAMRDQIPGEYEEVACFTLDFLLEREKLRKVDIIKIDAEGHEMSVLVGCEQVLSEFSPVILYENIAGSHGSNQVVAEYLVSIGYTLFYYRSYVKELIPIQNIEEIEGNLNIIAIKTG